MILDLRPLPIPLETLGAVVILGVLALGLLSLAVLAIRTVAGDKSARRRLRRTLTHGDDDGEGHALEDHDASGDDDP